MSKIDKLSVKQEARLIEWRDKWLAIGLSTSPCDRERVERAVDSVYQCANKKPPAIKIWLNSPIAGCYGAYFLKKVGAQVGDQVGDQVWDQVWAQVEAQVGAQVRAQVWDQVGDQVEAQVGAQVRAQVWAQVRDQVGDQVRAQVWECGYGSMDAGWLSYYSFIRDVLGLTATTNLVRGLIDISQCGWWWPFENCVILSERPNALRRDDIGRLHATDKAAISYPDGWSIYAIHGVRVPEYVVMKPVEITIAKISAEKNAEIRRVMIERYGEDRYILNSGLKAVATDQRFGDIYLERLEAGRPIAKICVTNRSPEPDGSYRKYWLDINPDHYNGDAARIPQAAVASTWRTTPGGRELFFKDWRDYSPVLET